MPRAPPGPGGDPVCPAQTGPDGRPIQLQFGVRKIKGVRDPKNHGKKYTFYEPCCFSNADRRTNETGVQHYDRTLWPQEKAAVIRDIQRGIKYTDNVHFPAWNTDWSDLYKFAGRGRNRHGARQRFNKLFVEEAPAAGAARGMAYHRDTGALG